MYTMVLASTPAPSPGDGKSKDESDGNIEDVRDGKTEDECGGRATGAASGTVADRLGGPGKSRGSGARVHVPRPGRRFLPTRATRPGRDDRGGAGLGAALDLFSAAVDASTVLCQRSSCVKTIFYVVTSETGYRPSLVATVAQDGATEKIHAVESERVGLVDGEDCGDEDYGDEDHLCRSPRQWRSWFDFPGDPGRCSFTSTYGCFYEVVSEPFNDPADYIMGVHRPALPRRLWHLSGRPRRSSVHRY